jgi:hypothetical protein
METKNLYSNSAMMPVNRKYLKMEQYFERKMFDSKYSNVI